MLCELVKDSSRGVIPEFTKAIEEKIVKEWPKPPFYDSYESMDLGYNDLTVVLFGYYDFRADKVIIEDEFVVGGPELHLKKLTDTINKKEAELWTNVMTGEIKKPYMRVSDTNLVAINEIRIHSGNTVNFTSAKKDDNDSAINNLRMMIANQKIIIHPRCVTLVRHLRNVKWSSPTNKTTFGRSPDDGHYDAVDALKYMVRHISYTKNPYPAGYGMNLRSQDTYINNAEAFRMNDPIQVYNRIFNRKKK
jgi:hypothetical protein